MDVQQFTTVCVYILAGILGLCVGSFLNVVIYRLPNSMSLAHPGSHCPRCGYVLKWYDNLPVFSYLLLGGRCRQCRERISLRYPVVELTNAFLWLFSVYVFYRESPLYTVTALVASSALICVFFIDLEHMLIFNRFHVILSLCGVAAMFSDSFTVWHDHLIGMLVGGGLFLGLYYASIAVLKKEGLGLGDVKYAAVAGLLLGWQKLILAILIASLAGSVFMIIANRIRRAEKYTQYPFGPFLAVGTLLTVFFGNAVIRWYLGVLFDLM